MGDVGGEEGEGEGGDGDGEGGDGEGGDGEQASSPRFSGVNEMVSNLLIAWILHTARQYIGNLTCFRCLRGGSTRISSESRQDCS